MTDLERKRDQLFPQDKPINMLVTSVNDGNLYRRQGFDAAVKYMKKEHHVPREVALSAMFKMIPDASENEQILSQELKLYER